MKFGRPDYDAAIQPWQAHRGHLVKDADGALCEVRGAVMGALHEALAAGTISPLIPVDEPVFLIRAADAAGPEAVRWYCGEAVKAGADPAVIVSVLAQVQAMELWQAEHGIVATPDLPSSVPAWPAPMTLAGRS